MRADTSGPDRFRSFPPDVLLGPLTELERLNAPAKLFVAGRLEVLELEPRVSIVGARTASAQGLGRAHRLAKELAGEGVVVVSGLAKGIDTAAHRGAIDAKGNTIAVLGTPLDRCYPKENDALLQLIMREHLAISQFPPGSPIQRYNFPQRNRTMALIAEATVIVEAGNSSGSLSQGWEALRLGRLVFMMKSVFERPGLTWPNKLLDYGARVLTRSEDLLENLPTGKARYAAAPF